MLVLRVNAHKCLRSVCHGDIHSDVDTFSTVSLTLLVKRLQSSGILSAVIATHLVILKSCFTCSDQMVVRFSLLQSVSLQATLHTGFAGHSTAS